MGLNFDLSMMFLMVGFASKEHEVILFIILFVAINVMNSFLWFKISANYFFHNKPVLRNISRINTKRMGRLINHDVTATLNYSSSLPSRVFCFIRESFLLGKAKFFSMRLRKFFTFPRQFVTFQPFFSFFADDRFSFNCVTFTLKAKIRNMSFLKCHLIKLSQNSILIKGVL